MFQLPHISSWAEGGPSGDFTFRSYFSWVAPVSRAPAALLSRRREGLLELAVWFMVAGTAFTSTCRRSERRRGQGDRLAGADDVVKAIATHEDLGSAARAVFTVLAILLAALDYGPRLIKVHGAEGVLVALAIGFLVLYVAAALILVNAAHTEDSWSTRWASRRSWSNPRRHGYNAARDSQSGGIDATGSGFPFGVTDWSSVEPTRHEGRSGRPPGVPANSGGVRVRMVEYTPGYAADHWCARGHILLCTEGELHTELEDGRRFIPTAGMSYQAGWIGGAPVFSRPGARDFSLWPDRQIRLEGIPPPADRFEVHHGAGLFASRDSKFPAGGGAFLRGRPNGRCSGGALHPLFLFLVPRRWAAMALQAALLLAAVEWVMTLVWMALERQALGEPPTRLCVILGAVAA